MKSVGEIATYNRIVSQTALVGLRRKFVHVFPFIQINLNLVFVGCPSNPFPLETTVVSAEQWRRDSRGYLFLALLNLSERKIAMLPFLKLCKKIFLPLKDLLNASSKIYTR